MSLRKAKKLLDQKKAKQKVLEVQEPEEEIQDPPKPASNAFQMFGVSDSEQEEPNETTNHNQQQEKLQEQPCDKTSKKKKKKKNVNKKQGNKETIKKQVSNQQQIDVEKIFKQAGMEYKPNSQTHNTTEPDNWEQILSINEARFNYEKQLRRHFGVAEGQMREQGDNPQLNKRQQKMQRRMKNYRKTMKKSVLSPGVRDEVYIREKFDVQRSEDQIKFVPTKKYAHYQVEYEAVRNTNDINALIGFSQTHPEHVDSLYAIGQFLRLQGNYQQADNLIQRVIYIYEMAGKYDLMQFIKTDVLKKQIAYDTYSTSLFMALFKFMDILSKKGCYRAALQYNKLLIKINTDDPTACLLSIDYNSISSKNYDYLLKFIANYSRYIGRNDASLYLLPNFIYSTALASLHIANSLSQSSELVVEENNMAGLLEFSKQHWQQALILPQHNNYGSQAPQCLILRAIIVYPELIKQIAIKNDYSKHFMNHPLFHNNQKKSFKQILQHEFWQIIPVSYSYYFLKLDSLSDSKGLDKIIEVYVERSRILWKSKEVMLWLKGAMGFVLNMIDDKQFQYQAFLEHLCIEKSGGKSIPFNLSRYEHISKANFSDRVDRIDLANIQDNQQEIHPNHNTMSLEGNPISLFLRSLLPWNHIAQPQEMGEFDPDMPDIQDD